jgi:hypothetical protein
LDYTGGKKLYRRVQSDRVKGMRRRMRRFGHLKKVTSMTRVMTTGGLPAMLYGAAVLGVPCGMLGKMRSIAAEVTATTVKRRNITLDLELADKGGGRRSDPAYAANRAVFAMRASWRKPYTRKPR